MKQENASFVAFPNSMMGQIFNDEKHPKFPIRYYNAINGLGVELKRGHSYYIYVYSGELRLVKSKATFPISDGMYCSFNYTDEILTGQFQAIVIEVLQEKGVYPETNFRAMFNIGGPIEDAGRLKYIDGCTDSLLIPPVKMGDPCLNHLHFPPDIIQTPHTHPSHRIGIVAKGEGECVTPFGTLPLKKGMIFVIKQGDDIEMAEGLDGNQYLVGTHKFNTDKSSMDVIAFHPDSDFGATDVNHPMINRTIVEGVSASQLEEIRTK